MRAFAPRNASPGRSRGQALSFDQHLSIGVLRQAQQVGRIRRQGLNPSPTIGNRLGNTGDFMRTQIIHHHHIARFQRRPQDVLDIGTKHLARRRPWNRQQRRGTAQRKRPDQGHVSPGACRHAVADALASGGASIASRHRQVDARFIDERQTLERTLTDLALVVLTRLAYSLGVALGGLGGLFFGNYIEKSHWGVEI